MSALNLTHAALFLPATLAFLTILTASVVDAIAGS
jgi:hypothetical protein